MIKDQSKFSSRTVFLNCCWSYHLTETVLRWFDHQDLAFYTFTCFFCIRLYRSACITVTLFAHHLFWHLFWVLELPVLVIMFCTVGFVQGATCCGFQQGFSWNTQWVSVWFPVLLWDQQWSTASCSETFLGYTVGSV